MALDAETFDALIDTVRRFVDLHVAQLARENAIAHDLVAALGREAMDLARISSARRLIDQEPHRPWSVATLARAVGMS